MSEWISVDEELPEYGMPVLLCFGKGPICTGYRKYTDRTGEVWSVHCKAFRNDPVSHWMPLPEPPK